MRESQIEKYLVKRVKELGGEVRKVQWIGRRGAPDRLVMLPSFRLRVTAEMDDTPKVRAYLNGVQAKIVAANPNLHGVTVWVELKATGEKPEPHQLREHKRMRTMGQRVEVIDSIEQVEELFK
ncbi:MAG: hypothetical protein C0422_09750 [Alcaligenaceae bacterium]|nr:hypothetical protein [Alcaligenaceae bacterium]